MTGPCAFHDESMAQLRDTLLHIKEYMREGITALNRQSEAFAEALKKITESQATRAALCARQDQRIGNAEQNQAQHREAHAQERAETLKERADVWSAVNKLRFHVYVGLGIGLALQVIVPILLRVMGKV